MLSKKMLLDCDFSIFHHCHGDSKIGCEGPMLDWHWQQVQNHVRRNQYNSFPKPGASAQVANSDGKDN